MNLGTEEDNNENKKGEDFKYEIVKDNLLKYDFTLKMILIGDSNVGKSALIEKIFQDKFSEDYKRTPGVKYFILGFNIVSDEDKPVLIYQIWSCGGDEKYRGLIKLFYQNVRVCLLAYDVTNEKSFNDINGWVNDVKDKNTDKTIHFVLIGTKIDLKDNRKVPKEAGENFAKTNNMRFVEVSAKTGDGIKELENILAKIIYEEFNKEKKKVEDDSEGDFIVGEKPTHSRSLCDCCKEICDNC